MNEDIKDLKITDVEKLQEQISALEEERDELQLQRDEARSLNEELERQAAWAGTLIEAIEDFERGVRTFGELAEAVRGIK